jgi:TolB protein
MNRIAYVSPEGNLFTFKPDGSDTQRLTDHTQLPSAGGASARRLDLNRFHTWPTWSPDGTKLAASYVQASSDQPQVSIQIIELATGRARTIYNNDLSAFSPVAQTAPHYLYWSPDSKSLAFVAATAQGLTLFIEDPEAPGPPAAVQTGAPIYFHWASDASSILLHIRQELKLSRKPFGAAPPALLANAAGFRVPALSPDARWMAYSVASESGGALFIADPADLRTAHAALTVGALSAFMWSPDGAELAVVDQADTASPLFQRLQVVSAHGGATRTITEEPLLAFYWSPDGQRIAWVAVDSEEGMFTWKVAPPSGGPAQQLFRFQPSSEMLAMLTFFDQFAYSHSPWSPDSSHLVMAGSPEPTYSRRNGQTSTGSRIYLVPVSGSATPQEIASGTLAVWSWN